jgi:hypothetical protein
MLMSWLSVPIQVDGSIVGAAIRQEYGVRFIAVDWRVGDLDQTHWNTADAAHRAAEQMIRTGKVANFNPPVIEE